MSQDAVIVLPAAAPKECLRRRRQTVRFNIGSFLQLNGVIEHCGSVITGHRRGVCILISCTISFTGCPPLLSENIPRFLIKRRNYAIGVKRGRSASK
jgi:hypothetical protein